MRTQGGPSRTVKTDRGSPRDRGQWFGLVILALPTAVIGLDLTALHMAIPSIAVDLRPSPTAQLWIVDSYGFAVAGLLLIMGNIGDRIGRRRLLMLGAAGFAVASTLAACAPTAEWLILARALLGIAGATLMPSTLSLIRDLFPDDQERSRAIAIWMAGLLTGSALGPLVGAAMLELWWWGAVFLLAVPVMVVLLVLGPLLLPTGRASPTGPLDVLSVGLALLGVLPVVYALKHAAAHGPGLETAVLVPLGTIAVVVFMKRQRRLEQPLLDVRLFTGARFAAATLTHFGSLLVLGGMQYLFALYLQVGLGLRPLTAGLGTVPGASLGLLGAVIAPAVAARASPRLTFGGGLALGAGGAGVMGLAPGAEPAVVASGFAVLSFAVGLVTTLTTDHIIAAAPARRAGMASGITETSAELGIAMGIAVLGSIATAIQLRTSDETVTPSATPVTREAFIAGMSASALLAAAMLIGLSALWLRYLRRAPAPAIAEAADHA